MLHLRQEIAGQPDIVARLLERERIAARIRDPSMLPPHGSSRSQPSCPASFPQVGSPNAPASISIDRAA